MDSWWDLGEGSGQRGRELDPRILKCPFCLEAGNFALEHRATKKKANSSKALNFDTLKCGNCSGYVMVLWSAGELWGKGFPWFRDASIAEITRVELPSPRHLYWPDLDIDLAVESIVHPERYPLVSAAQRNSRSYPAKAQQRRRRQ